MKTAHIRVVAVALLAGSFAAAAAASEKPVELRRDARREQVEANCGACHSLDYVLMNSPFPSAAQWDAEVAKMIKVFGAPIEAADAKIIADYLKKNYGS